jgi:NAD(P)-dependent dehydrogenase (short-subunit alcohol dehydrogenase family)
VASLAGRVIAVAGATGNLGPTVVERLGGTGAVLALGGRDGARLEALGVGEPYAVDLLDLDAASAWADSIAERHGRIDALVHMVGGWRGGTPVEQQPEEDWKWLESMLFGTLRNATRAFAPHLLESRGRFLLTSTAQAQAPTSGNASYAAAKAAAEAWALALADRFRGSGATANIVVIGGAVVTPAMRAEKPDDKFAGSTPAEDIAGAIAYLVSDEAARMNGQRLILRGAY